MAETEVILLTRFVRSGDAEAFAEIIRRYAGLVYGAALRVLADADRASDVAQDTFLQLAKDAGSVSGSLPGWLHRVATHKAIDQVRRDTTRKRREAEYTAGRPEEETTEWKEISPFVDEGLNLLDSPIRSILIAHFLEGRSTREIARTQGISQATVSRRIETGVELLRAGLRRRGILVTAGALALLMGDNALEAAPPALLTELGKIALVSGALATSTASAGAVSGLGTWTAGVLAGVKANMAAVATSVVLIGAGSVLTYRHIAKSAGHEVPARRASVESRVVDSGRANLFDPAGETLAVPGVPPVAAANPGEDVAGRASPIPVRQGLPGPEAETDPRTYTGPRGEGPLVARLPDSPDLPRASDRSASGVNVDMLPVPASPDPALEGEDGQPGSRTAETPYETVMKLRREAAAGVSDGFVDPNLTGDFTLGPVVATAELTFSPPFRGSPVGAIGFQLQTTTTVRPAHVLETPPDAPLEPVYFVIHTADRQIQGITYRSVRSSGEVMLILDTDGDGLWSDEKMYVGRRLWALTTTATYEFGPVFLRQGAAEPTGEAIYAQCSNGQWLTFWPAVYRDGQIVLDGKAYRVGLIDADFDGRFNEALTPAVVRDPRAGCDVVAIDFNGDSQFTRRRPDVPEVMPLGRLIKIAGRCYGVEAAQDGGTIELRRAEPVRGPAATGEGKPRS